MECLLGIVGKDFVVLASDTMDVRSIVVMKGSEDRSRRINNRNIIMYSGEPGDSVNFVDYVEKNIKLNEIRSSREFSTSACAGFVRHSLAKALRSQSGPYQTNLLIAGYDCELKKPKLFWIDYFAACIDANYACQGYGSFFCYSTMDRYYRPDMSREEAISLIKKCIFELKTRFIVNLANWQIQIITADGVETALSLDTPTATFAENVPLRAAC